MKKSIRLFCCSMMLLLITSLSCQAGDTNADVDTVKAAIQKHAQAFDSKSAVDTAAFYADNAVIMGTGEGELYVGKEAIANALSQFFNSFDKETREVTFHEVHVNGDTAWTMSNITFTTTAKDKKSKYQLNISRVLTKKDGNWLCVAEHFSHLVGGK